MSEALDSELAAALGSRVRARRPVSGGDINEAWDVSLEDGRRVFVKTNPSAPDAMFPREAEGLRWLAEPGALRLPEVLAEGPRFLVLEHIETGRPGRHHDERLGRGLAALHRASPGTHGWAAPNFIGSLEQDIRGEGLDWTTFYVRRRLEPLRRRAEAHHLATVQMERALDLVFEHMPSLVGPKEPPARLHGDLWGGNAMVDSAGAPVLIDPAVYGGHREIDLAMMALFGGFSARVFDAYQEAWPLAPGWPARVPLYQLYPLLVHVNLFGGSYVSAVTRAAERALSARG